MKTFRFVHSIVVWIILSIILVLSSVGIYFNVYSAIHNDDRVFKIISYCILATICLVLAICVLSVMIKSQYVIKDGALTLRFGLFSTRTNLQDVKSFTLLNDGELLVAEFTNSRFFTIVIKKELYGEFVETVKNVNQEVAYFIAPSEKNHFEQ